MSQVTAGLVLVLVTAAPALAAPDPQAGPPRESKAQKLRRQLAQATVKQPAIDPNTPLKDALEFLASNHNLTFLVNEKDFEAIGVQKAGETAVQLPPLAGVSLNQILRQLLDQVQGDAHLATFVIRGDHIEITTTAHIDPRQWAQVRALAPVVEADFDRVCLEEAAQELADRTGISIVVDVRLGEKARKPVTARFANTRLDTAILLLADMADLQAIAMENVLYVTSKENAKALQAEQEKADAARRRREELQRRETENPLVIPRQ